MTENTNNETVIKRNLESSELYFGAKSSNTRNQDYFKRRNNSDDFSRKSPVLLAKKKFRLEPLSEVMRTPSM